VDGIVRAKRRVRPGGEHVTATQVQQLEHALHGRHVDIVGMPSRGTVHLGVQEPGGDQSSILLRGHLGRERVGLGLLDHQLHRRQGVGVGGDHQRPRTSARISSLRAGALRRAIDRRLDRGRRRAASARARHLAERGWG
jgi:hypothetical protein